MINYKTIKKRTPRVTLKESELVFNFLQNNRDVNSVIIAERDGDLRMMDVETFNKLTKSRYTWFINIDREILKDLTMFKLKSAKIDALKSKINNLLNTFFNIVNIENLSEQDFVKLSKNSVVYWETEMKNSVKKGTFNDCFYFYFMEILKKHILTNDKTFKLSSFIHNNMFTGSIIITVQDKVIFKNELFCVYKEDTKEIANFVDTANKLYKQNKLSTKEINDMANILGN